MTHILQWSPAHTNPQDIFSIRHMKLISQKAFDCADAAQKGDRIFPWN